MNSQNPYDTETLGIHSQIAGILSWQDFSIPITCQQSTAVAIEEGVVIDDGMRAGEGKNRG